MPNPLRMLLLIIAPLGLFLAGPAPAAVEITFYSREMGSSFPHAFVTLTGTLDRGGERIDSNYGFTATHVTPAILMGSVRGKIDSAGPNYVRSSDPHFSLLMTDAQYDAVMATVYRWRDHPQPSYHLNRRNCVFFIGEVATSLGMRAATPANLMKKPRAYTEFLTSENRSWLASRGARFLRPVPATRTRRS